MSDKKANRLIHEKSPYLQQHAHNPVDWFPWGTEAFAKAAQESKPIFLSIGYSTCHWCHVMEKESFEDEEVAELLNQHFVSIKVDREERPDIDHIYMGVCQMLTGQGGWPLTVVLTPDQLPFFTGTYFPKHARFGQAGLMQVLPEIVKRWQEERPRMESIGQQIMKNISSRSNAPVQVDFDSNDLASWVKEAVAQLRDDFDPRYGGFGQAPKFPIPHTLMFLMQYGTIHKDNDATSMALTTLQKMAQGGIYDHVGKGFARYSTDEKWLVPHFEKMLYDNALLTLAYTTAYQMTADENYKNIAKDIITYVLSVMTDNSGGFYSAEDADSEGEEGKFYCWTPAQVNAVLGDELGPQYCRYYGITEQGNFEGSNIPNMIGQSLADFAQSEGIDAKMWLSQVADANTRLGEARDGRVHPHKDDKVLTAWNALMIQALARAAVAFGESEYLHAAQQSLRFIETHLFDDEDRLYARYRDGERAHVGYLDDYAFLMQAHLDMYRATFDETYVQQAVKLADQMIELFWDETAGAFYFTGADNETLIARPKEHYDGALPAGNSVAALALLMLGRITGNTRYEALADQVMQASRSLVEAYPAGYTYLLMAAQFALGPTREVVVAGSPDDEETQDWLRQLSAMHLPNTVLVFHPEGSRQPIVESLCSYISPQVAIDGKATVYICQNYACQMPLTDLEQVKRALIQ